MLFRSSATTEIYTTANTLSLHDALPIFRHAADATDGGVRIGRVWYTAGIGEADCQRRGRAFEEDGGAEPVRARRGHERALEHGTRGMVGTSAWMRPVKCIHLIDQSSSKRLFLGPGRARD